MKKEDLLIQIKTKKSFLCIGLDTDIKKIPKFLLKSEDPIFEFNKKIIDATTLTVLHINQISHFMNLWV